MEKTRGVLSMVFHVISFTTNVTYKFPLHSLSLLPPFSDPSLTAQLAS